MISLRDIITLQQKQVLAERRTIPDDQIKERSWVLVFRYNPSLEILLAKDDEGKWSFPGGQWDEKESAEDAAWRELKEETGIVPDKLDFLKTFYHDKPNKLKVSHVFYTEVSKNTQITAHSDVEKLKWFRLNDMPALDGLSKPKEEAVQLAAKELDNPEKELNEYISLFTAMGYQMPKTLLTERRKLTENGFLIVFEGIDGAGKTTQRKNLKQWLEKKGWKVTSSKWGTSPTIAKLIKIGKIQKWLSPMLFSLLNASDMIWRYENEIKPALDKGHIVLCDRYYYTSYVRDKLRGIQTEMLDHIYGSFMEPDLVVHFEVDPKVAVERLLKDKGFKWYSSGMDIGYGGSIEECALKYEKNMDKEYRQLLPKSKNYKHIKTDRDIAEIFDELKKFVRDRVDAARRHRKQKVNEEVIVTPIRKCNKLSWVGLMKEVLLERMSFADLYNRSDPARIKRSDNVRVRPMRVTTIDGNETWTFRYKSRPSTTGQPWQGYVQFFKEDVSGKESASELDCMVDCSCPDYRFRWAYANTKQDASRIGPGSLNQCTNAPPNKMNPSQNPGMCKHLIGLGEYLKTNIEPQAPEPPKVAPTRPVYEPQRVKPAVKKPPIIPPTEAPSPDDETDTYSDTRAGTLTEAGNKLYEKINNFVKNNPEFDATYEDDEER